MKSLSPILSAAALIPLAAAARWVEPSATPIGEWAGGMGFSPIPTEAPGVEVGGIGIPKELRKRQDFPDNWCGYVNGDVSEFHPFDFIPFFSGFSSRRSGLGEEMKLECGLT